MKEYKLAMPKLLTSFLFGMGSIVVLYALWLAFQLLVANDLNDMQLRMQAMKVISTSAGGISLLVSGTIVYLLTEIATGVNKK